MPSISMKPETMTSRERVKRTFAYEKTDRVPIDYSGNEGINARLMNYFGAKNYDSLLDALGVDYRGVGAPYTGKPLFEAIQGRQVDPIYGFITRWVAHSSGGYWDFCDFPLIEASDEEIINFPVPDPEDFDYGQAEAQIKAHPDRALFVGNAGVGDIINSTGRVMGMEETLVRLQMEDEATLEHISKRVNMQLGVLERILDRHGKRIDFMWLGEDLGTQHTPMISRDLYKNTLMPFHQKFIDLAKSYSLPVMVHTCGSSSWVYEDFIAMGVTAVDTLQPEAVNMSPRYLKEHFGGRLSFHGCISTAGALAYGSVEDIVSVCQETLDIMMEDGGYHFAPTHSIQDNSPTENVVAMYETAHAYGRY